LARHHPLLMEDTVLLGEDKASSVQNRSSAEGLLVRYRVQLRSTARVGFDSDLALGGPSSPGEVKGAFGRLVGVADRSSRSPCAPVRLVRLVPLVRFSRLVHLARVAQLVRLSRLIRPVRLVLVLARLICLVRSARLSFSTRPTRSTRLVRLVRWFRSSRDWRYAAHPSR
jgi:hypothetical protein